MSESEYKRNQMSPSDVAESVARGDYMRKNGDTSADPKPKNEWRSYLGETRDEFLTRMVNSGMLTVVKLA